MSPGWIAYYTFVAAVIVGVLLLFISFWYGVGRLTYDEFKKRLGLGGAWWKLPLCAIGAVVFSFIIVYLLFTAP